MKFCRRPSRSEETGLLNFSKSSGQRSPPAASENPQRSGSETSANLSNQISFPYSRLSCFSSS